MTETLQSSSNACTSSSSSSAELLALASLKRAEEWAQIDPNEETKSYISSLIEKCKSSSPSSLSSESSKAPWKELQELFPSDGSRIGFGTAGLRSGMKPGPLGMNDLVIIQTTQGLARYCQKYQEELNQQEGNDNDNDIGNNKKLLAVIGYDHRSNPSLNLSSQSFAILSKLAFLEAGYDCILLDGYIATPLVAYAITKLEANVGIMVTASHNPKDDAGFKVYWRDGCQIRAPVDSFIKDSIVEEGNLRPWVDYGSLVKERFEKSEAGEYDDSCHGLGDVEITKSLLDDYYSAISFSGLVVKNGNSDNNNNTNKPKIAYTAMHGIGHPFALRSFQTFGLDPFHSVPSQQEPNHSFPTVPFPNPEEKGALNLAMEFASSNECDLILANDPDADRLAVAERCRESGVWTTFTGDQIGTMLGLWIWETMGKDSGKVAMCASTVSSKMLATIAEKEGFYFEDTLTGFKWIGSRLVELRKEGYRSLFGYEEAIGFCCGDVVSDKDGLTALGVMSQLANYVYGKGEGWSLNRHMQSLYEKYGDHCSNNGYYFCYEPETIDKIFKEMRNGGEYMTHVGPYEIESIRDLGYPGYDSTTADKKPTLPISKSSPMMTIRFKNGTVAQFRGSGTEPKFKYYIEMRGKPGVKRDVVMKDLRDMSDFILEELLHPADNGLKSQL